MAFRAHGPNVPKTQSPDDNVLETFGNRQPGISQIGRPRHDSRANETMVLCSVDHHGSGRSRLILHEREHAQPRPRPARTASIISMAAPNAASISKSVVSSKCASDAALSGAVARLV